MDPTREILNAFVDGELPPAEMERIAALLAARPDLEAYVVQQEKLRANLKQKFEGVLAASVPQHLVDTARTAKVSWRWRLRAALGRRFVLRSLAPAGAALALGLVVGIALQPATDLTLSASGQMLARGDLGQALDRKLASAGYDGQGPRIGISFRDHAGEDCRTFASDAHTSSTLAGLACHRGGRWVVATLVTRPPEISGTYRMAGSEMPDAVRRAVDDAIDGMPFDATAEAEAQAHGWSGK
jgi:hypothetical protein